MMEPAAGLASVRVTVAVAVDPATAFVVFTEEIGEWYRTGLATTGRRASTSTLAFEPGAGGRLVELDRRDGQVVERARITVWEPGVRLVFVDQRETEVDVRFESVPTGTKVVLEHRGLDRLPPDSARSQAKFGWSRLGVWFEGHMERWRRVP
jgi:hypothetical protein